MGLQNTEVGVFQQVIQGKAVAVYGDDAGNDKQQTPQKNKNARDNFQQDHFACNGKPVKQGGQGHFFASADRQAIGGETCSQDDGNQPDQNGDKPVNGTWHQNCGVIGVRQVIGNAEQLQHDLLKSTEGKDDNNV